MFLQVPLGIVQKDETKTAEVIELLDIYKRYVPAKSDGNPFLIILYCDGLSCERVLSALFSSQVRRRKWYVFVNFH
jgi:hypothetical protein